MKPILLLGPQNSGKTYIANIMANRFVAADNSLYLSYYEARNRTHFINPIGNRIYDAVVIEEIPTEHDLLMLWQYIKGIQTASKGHTLFIFTSQSIDATLPFPDFQKIICSYNMWEAQYGRD